MVSRGIPFGMMRHQMTAVCGALACQPSSSLLFAASVCLLFLRPAAASGQQQCWACRSEFNHPEWGDIHRDNQGDVPWVTAPDGKHEAWGLDPCSVAHFFEGCSGGGGTDEDLDRDLDVVLNGADVAESELISAFRRSGRRVAVHEARGAVQILACGSTSIVLAHVPLPEQRIALLLGSTRIAHAGR